MASTWTIDSTAGQREQVGVRRIGVADLRDALSQGWSDFLAVPTQLVFLCILYPIIGLVAARAAASYDVMPLLFPLVGGFALVGPILALGLYELSRRREQGLPVSWLNVFSVLRSPSLFGIAMLGIMLLAIFVAWLGAAKAIYAMTVGTAVANSADTFVTQVTTSPGFWPLVIVGNLVGALFALLVLTLTVVSFPMLLDRDVGPVVALQTSVRAVRTNPGVMLLWGLIVAAILVLGCLPLFIGLAIALPVLGHATWHLYRKVVAAN